MLLSVLALPPVVTGCAADLMRLPPPVRRAVESRAGGRRVTYIEREVHAGRNLYEVTLTEQGRHCSVKLNESGEVLEEEWVTAVADVPPAVIDAARRACPDATLRKVELVSAGGATYYELKLSLGRAHHELRVTPQGHVMAAEPEER